MLPSTKIWELAALAIMILLHTGITATTNTYYMTEMCSESKDLIINAAAILKLTHHGFSTSTMDCEVRGACDDNFLCDNGYRIPDRLTCDGNNNCGDNSDEGTVCDVHVGAILGIGLMCRKCSYYKHVVPVSQKPLSLSRQNSEYRTNYGTHQPTWNRPVSPPSYHQSARV